MPLFALGAVIAMSRHISEAPALLTAIAAGGAASVLALLALTVDESDEAFADIYSTAVSLQNLLPRVSQRLLIVMVGTLVTITGTGLTQETKVTFNAVSASFTVNSDTQITATVPAGDSVWPW